LVYKRRYSGFYHTNLDGILKSLNPDLVEVVGVCTSICVMDTVGGLANRDYKINVYKNMVADFDQEMHEISLKRMKNLYGANIL
jgi:nicotinamidase-related amidase